MSVPAERFVDFSAIECPLEPDWSHVYYPANRRRVPACHVCGRRCEIEIEPALTQDGVVVLAAELEPDVWTIRLRNRLAVDACASCWGLWPDPWKVFPPFGFGRGDEEPDRTPQLSPISADRLAELLRETSP